MSVTSGSVSTSSYDGRYAKLEWTCTQSGATSTINWTASLAGGASNWYVTSQCFFEISCASGTPSTKKVTVLSYDTSRKSQKGTIGSGSFTIAHNSAGAANFTIKLSVATHSWEVNCTGSKTWTLPSRYTLTLNKGTGIASVTGGGAYAEGTQVSIGATPSSGYNFSNWTNSSGTAISSSASHSITLNASTTLTANAVLKTYKINYDANGGSGVPSAQNKIHGTNLTLSSIKPTRTGYAFKSWNTKADGSGTSYAAGATFTSNAGTTLYAIWTVYVLTVKYNANGGTQDSSASYTLPYTTTVNYGANYNGSYGLYDITTFKLKKDGYYATHWNTNANGTGITIDCTTSYTAQALASACGKDLSIGNVTLNFYPKWIANPYTVVYDGNGATDGATNNTTHVYGTAKALAANGFSRTGYVFSAWNTKADGSGTSYTSEQSVSNLTTIKNGTVTLYAIWTPWTYTIKYFPNGGIGTVFTSSHTYGISSTLTANKFTRENYTFLGWSTSATGTVIYTDGAIAPDNITSNKQQIDLYAIWSQSSPWTLSTVYVRIGDTWRMF